MKRGLILLLILGIAGRASAQDHEQGLMLPGLRQPLRAGMSLTEIRAALPNPDVIAWETLANGTTFCYTDVDYPLLIQMYNGSLIDIHVDEVKAESKFGKWFAEQVQSLSGDSLRYDSAASGREIPRERWMTPTATWQREPTVWRKKRVSYEILFPAKLLTLGNGMMVRQGSPETLQADTLTMPYTLPRQTSSPQFGYPQAAAQTHATGEVQVQLYVDKHGDVQRWMIRKIDPVGVGFAREVESVATQFKFEPALKNGQPVDAWIVAPCDFRFYEAEEIYLPRKTGH
jgi:TonB family protein